MKAVILAAWQGTRLLPLTKNTPKPLVSVWWKSIIEAIMKNTYKYVDEFFIVVKYKKEIFEEKLWKNFKGKKIHYIVQWEEKWTAAALWNIPIKKWDILLMNGDTIFDEKDYLSIIEEKNSAILVKKVENPEKYGIFSEEKWYATSIIEKPQTYIGNLANLGVYKFDEEILKFSKQVQLSQRWEYEITDAINSYLKENKVKLLSIKKDFIDITYSWDILQANASLLKNQKEKIKWKIEDGVSIKGKIQVWKNTIIKSGTYIEGNCIIWENCIIGPNAYLRDTVIVWNNCKIWNAVEVKNTTIGDNSNIAHLSYIWDSIIGNMVNIWWGFLSANIRHDKSTIKSPVKWELIDTGLKKLWVIVADGVKTGVKTCSMPGRVITENTLPGSIIS